MIVSGLIEKLLVIPMILGVILASGDLEVRDPCKLTVDIALFSSERRPRWHSCTSNRILLIWIKRLLWFVRNKLLTF